MELNEETVNSYKELMINPEKHGLDFLSLSQTFEVSEVAKDNSELYKQYCNAVNSGVPKVIFYIVMNEVYGLEKTPQGTMGCRVAFKPGVI